MTCISVFNTNAYFTPPIAKVKVCTENKRVIYLNIKKVPDKRL
jgi:hypothetical protein